MVQILFLMIFICFNQSLDTSMISILLYYKCNIKKFNLLLNPQSIENKINNIYNNKIYYVQIPPIIYQNL